MDASQANAPSTTSSRNSQRPGVLFRLVAIFGGIFAFTALCMFMTTLGHPDAPPNRFFNRYGTTLIVVEVMLLVAAAVVAMFVDGRRSQGPEDRRSPAFPPPHDTREGTGGTADSPLSESENMRSSP